MDGTELGQEALVFAGAPAGSTNQTTHNIIISLGGDFEVTQVKKALLFGSDNCMDAEYGEWLDISEQVHLETKEDGFYTLCAIGRDAQGIEMKVPAKKIWHVDSTPPEDFLILSSGKRFVGTSDVSIHWESKERGLTFQVFVATDPDCVNVL